MEINPKKILLLAKKHKLKLLILFGSQAQGGTHVGSDVDLAFFPREKIDTERLREDLMRLFKRADLDLIDISATHNHLLRYQIMRHGKVLYEESVGLKSKWEGQSYIDYMDFKCYYEMRSKLLSEKIEAMAHG